MDAITQLTQEPANNVFFVIIGLFLLFILYKFLRISLAIRTLKSSVEKLPKSIEEAQAHMAEIERDLKKNGVDPKYRIDLPNVDVFPDLSDDELVTLWHGSKEHMLPPSMTAVRKMAKGPNKISQMAELREAAQQAKLEKAKEIRDQIDDETLRDRLEGNQQHLKSLIDSNRDFMPETRNFLERRLENINALDANDAGNKGTDDQSEAQFSTYLTLIRNSLSERGLSL